MRLPHNTLRRVALLAAVIAGPTLAACSNEGPLAPQAPTRVAVPGGNQSGFTVGWGVNDDPNGGAITSGLAGRPTGEVGATTNDTTAVVKAPTPGKIIIGRR